MEWQAHVARVATEWDSEQGQWYYPVVAVTVPRQAGKTAMQLAVALHRASLKWDSRCFYTAQTRSAARLKFLHDWMPQVKHSLIGPRIAAYRGVGNESMSWKGDDGDQVGGFVAVFAPEKEALHGTANDLVTVDEAWAHDPIRGAELEQAILPTFNTKPGQLWVISTAGTAASSWLRGYVDQGRAAVESGANDGLAYFEWGVPEAEDASDLDTVLRWHPSWGYTLRRQAVEAFQATASDEDFRRAYGNQWGVTTSRQINLEDWVACKDTEQAMPGRGSVALGIAADLDRTSASIAAAWEDGELLRIELVDKRPGTTWVPARLKELVGKWQPVAPVAYDPIGPAAYLAADAGRLGVRVAPLHGGDYAEACQRFVARAEEHRLRHRGQADLDAALHNAAPRPLGPDRWIWSRRHSSGTIDPIEAVTVAAHRAGTTRPPVMV